MKLISRLICICMMMSLAGVARAAEPESKPSATQATGESTTKPKKESSNKAAKEKPPEEAPQKWNQMQYGSLLAGTYENRKDGKEFTNKGIAITLGALPSPAYVIFDTELLRYSAAWTGKYLHYYGVIFDGSHGPMASPWGDIAWAVKGQRPGVSLTDKFDDPRPEPYGPLPRDTFGRYNGLYRNGEKTILSYSVGGCQVLEMPYAGVMNGQPIFYRAMQIAPSDKAINIVISEDSADPQPSRDPATKPTTPPLQVAAQGASIQSNDGMNYLHIPAHDQPLHIAVAITRGKSAPTVSYSHVDLASLCKGGPQNWPITMQTKGTLGSRDGPYVVDTLTVPLENPYQSWMRFGAFDLFADGKRAAVTTWSGDVWIVSGIDDKLDKLTWKRYAAGLFQPLGLKIVKDEIYVMGRDQITRLHDLNGDGEADHYENFNNDVLVSPSFHEFAFDLQQDSKGNFYFSKGGAVNPGGRGWQRITAHHGTILRVSPDGAKMDVYATGVRAPNGMSLGPNDEITVADNQGTWTPVCRLSFVKPGGFLGVTDLSHMKELPTSYGDPICWFPYPDIDNSSGGGAWLTTDKWGPFQNRLLHTSYGQCSLFLVMVDESGSTMQGGYVKFPGIEFDSGICRGRIGPVDGQLYLSGLKGWQTRAAKDACLQRVRYTGKPVRMPTSFHVKENGVELGFTVPLDPETAGDVDSYAVEQWNYIWSKDYGSPEVHVDDPSEKGRQPVKISAARVSADKKSVLLVMPDIQPVMQMKIALNIDAADGETMQYDVYGTLNAVPNYVAKPSTKPVTQPTAAVQ